MNATANEIYVASLLAGFFEAGWSVQVLLGDMDRAQYEASRLARPAIQKHLRTMATTAASLPGDVREQMPKVDWQSWEDLGEHLPPRSPADRDLVWTVLEHWLPPQGGELRRYRQQLPGLWRYRF